MLDEELVSWLERNTPRSASVLMYKSRCGTRSTGPFSTWMASSPGAARRISEATGAPTGAITGRIWVANQAMFDRRDMLADDAIFARARSALAGQPVLSEVTIEGVSFRLDERRGTTPPSRVIDPRASTA